jgi:5'/3'-nucleotidase SurE
MGCVILGNMNILLTNDDGIQAPGIKAIEQAIPTKGVNVVIAAPASERSASSLRSLFQMVVFIMPFTELRPIALNLQWQESKISNPMLSSQESIKAQTRA